MFIKKLQQNMQNRYGIQNGNFMSGFWGHFHVIAQEFLNIKRDREREWMYTFCAFSHSCIMFVQQKNASMNWLEESQKQIKMKYKLRWTWNW